MVASMTEGPRYSPSVSWRRGEAGRFELLGNERLCVIRKEFGESSEDRYFIPVAWLSARAVSTVSLMNQLQEVIDAVT